MGSISRLWVAHRYRTGSGCGRTVSAQRRWPVSVCGHSCSHSSLTSSAQVHTGAYRCIFPERRSHKSGVTKAHLEVLVIGCVVRLGCGVALHAHARGSQQQQSCMRLTAPPVSPMDPALCGLAACERSPQGLRGAGLQRDTAHAAPRAHTWPVLPLVLYALASGREGQREWKLRAQVHCWR